MHSAQGYPHIFSAQGLRNGFSQTGLAHTRRTVEAENRGFHISLELQGGQIFDDSVLHAVYPVMVLVQHLHRVLEVKIVFGVLVPRQVCKELQVVELYAVVRGGRILPFELEHLLFEDGLHLVRPACLGCLLAQFCHVLLVVHSQLLLDGPELAVEEIFPLLLVHFPLHLHIDFILQLHNLALLHKQLQQPFAPFFNRG